MELTKEGWHRPFILGFPEEQNPRCMYRQTEIHSEKLAHVILEADKSQGPQSARGETQEHRCCHSSPGPEAFQPQEEPVFQCESESRRKRMSQLKAVGQEAHPPFLKGGQPFCSIQALNRTDGANQVGGAICLTQTTDAN